MDTPIDPQVCPLCGSDKYMGKKSTPLYGKLVCKKCNNRFALRRSFAFFVDFILWLGAVIVVVMVAGLQGDEIRGLAVLAFLVFCLKDGFSGYSFGKALMGLQVISTTSGKPIGWGTSFKRNLPLIVLIVL